MQLDVGGIAQGYIAQQVINYLSRLHIDIALVDERESDADAKHIVHRARTRRHQPCGFF